MSTPPLALHLAQQLLAELSAPYQVPPQPTESPTKFVSPQDIADFMAPRMDQLEQEELWVILVNTRNTLIGTEMLYRGTLNSAHVRTAEVFRLAVRTNAAAIVVVHNHPSGDPTPSEPDINVTRLLVLAAKTLDIQLLDHIIVAPPGRWYSLKEHGHV